MGSKELHMTEETHSCMQTENGQFHPSTTHHESYDHHQNLGETGTWKPLLYLQPPPLRDRAKGGWDRNSLAPGKRSSTWKHIVLIHWFLAPTAFGLESIPVLVEATQVHIFPFHMWIFTLLINISCTELRHRIASQSFVSLNWGAKQLSSFQVLAASKEHL